LESHRKLSKPELRHPSQRLRPELPIDFWSLENCNPARQR